MPSRKEMQKLTDEEYSRIKKLMEEMKTFNPPPLMPAGPLTYPIEYTYPKKFYPGTISSAALDVMIGAAPKAPHKGPKFIHMPTHDRPILSLTKREAVSMLFRPGTEHSAEHYNCDYARARLAVKDAFGLSEADWNALLDKEGKKVDHVFNKAMWYVARMMQKSRIMSGVHWTQTSPLPKDLYQIIKGIYSTNDAMAFQALEDRLSEWSGAPQEIQDDPLAFDANEMERNLHLCGLKRRPLRPEEISRLTKRCPDPSTSSGVATAPPRPATTGGRGEAMKMMMLDEASWMTAPYKSLGDSLRADPSWLYPSPPSGRKH